jgi:hypothetical protein
MSHNPFATAFNAAWSELSSDEAKHWYLEQTEAGAARHIGAITALMVCVYALGVQARQWVEASTQPMSEVVADGTTSLNEAVSEPILEMSGAMVLYQPQYKGAQPRKDIFLQSPENCLTVARCPVWGIP